MEDRGDGGWRSPLGRAFPRVRDEAERGRQWEPAADATQWTEWTEWTQWT
jgi:hypothetical protein